MCIYVNTFIICLDILLYVKKGPHFIKQFSIVTNNLWLQMTLASTYASFRNQHDPGKKRERAWGESHSSGWGDKRLKSSPKSSIRWQSDLG